MPGGVFDNLLFAIVELFAQVFILQVASVSQGTQCLIFICVFETTILSQYIQCQIIHHVQHGVDHFVGEGFKVGSFRGADSCFDKAVHFLEGCGGRYNPFAFLGGVTYEPLGKRIVCVLDVINISIDTPEVEGRSACIHCPSFGTHAEPGHSQSLLALVVRHVGKGFLYSLEEGFFKLSDLDACLSIALNCQPLVNVNGALDPGICFITLDKRFCNDNLWCLGGFGFRCFHFYLCVNASRFHHFISSLHDMRIGSTFVSQ